MKEPKSREIGNDDMFSFNDDFQSKLFKIKIGLVAATRDSEPQQQETREKVEEDRKPQIDAAIVRVMKVSPVGTRALTGLALPCATVRWGSRSTPAVRNGGGAALLPHTVWPIGCDRTVSGFDRRCRPNEPRASERCRASA